MEQLNWLFTRALDEIFAFSKDKYFLFFVMQKQPPEVFVKKDTLAQVFSCEFCEISKNTSGQLLLVMHVVFNLLYDIDYQCSLQKLIDSHWFKNVLVEWFCNQLCLFFFHKIMKFYQDICFAWTSRTSAAFFFSHRLNLLLIWLNFVFSSLKSPIEIYLNCLVKSIL